MPRIPVPDDYDSGHVSVSGSDDYQYGQSDVNLDDTRHARDLSVREDDDGRYVGCSKYHVDAVAEFLGVTENSSDDEEDGGVCGAELSQGGTCERPADECPYHES